MSGSLDLPTAILVAGAMLLVFALAGLLRHGRRASRGFVSDVDRATLATLHTASLASRHLQDGLTPTGPPVPPSTCARCSGRPRSP